jgi:hypothetical protein
MCWGDDAIAEFGVGKNMVSSMRHWATSAGVLTEDSKKIYTTELGSFLLGDNGVDPYLERAASLWLLHWRLARQKKKTTLYWAFNYYPSVVFEIERFSRQLFEISSWPKTSMSTLKNDVSCFVRTYAQGSSAANSELDDRLESPLAELGLLRQISKRDEFSFMRGEKTSLGSGVFAFALIEFWNEFSPNTSTLSFETIAHEFGSPGRVFLLEENDIAERLFGIEEATGGALQWSETAGLKQIVRTSGTVFENPLELARHDY